MIFTAYLGAEHGLPTWETAVEHHARWLGLTPITQSERLPDGRRFAFGWLRPSELRVRPNVQHTPEHIRFHTSGHGSDGAQRADAATENLISVELSLPSGELEIRVPPTTPEILYHARDARGYVVANDLRLAIGWTGLELDERYVYPLFRCGGGPPPFTVSKGVKRIPQGHSLKIRSQLAEPVVEAASNSIINPHATDHVDEPEERVLRTLDGILARVPPSSLLYFSGGVDSALMAARLAELGRADVRLVNLSFGDHDPEAEHALRVANHLGLKCETVVYTERDLPGVLDQLARDYTLPFGDTATVPMNVLVRATAASGGSPVGALEGIAADGAFSLGVKYHDWKRVFSVPWPARRVVGGAFAKLKLWQARRPGGRTASVARRSLQMPLHFASMPAQNALEGIAFTVPREVQGEIESALEQCVYAVSEGFVPEERLSLLHLMYLIPSKYVPKSFDPVRIRGMLPLYPFLEPAMVRLSTSLTWDQKSEGGEKKRLIKKLLARQVPEEFVYRRKSGFDPPYATMFTGDTMQQYLNDVILSPSNVLAGLYDARVVREMLALARRRGSLRIETYEFLWALAFSSGWLRQFKA